MLPRSAKLGFLFIGDYWYVDPLFICGSDGASIDGFALLGIFCEALALDLYFRWSITLRAI